MTGFSRIETELPQYGRVVLEASSLNHRFIEVDVRLPKSLTPLIFPINELVRKRFSRGKFLIFLKFAETEKVPTKLVFREDLLREYLNILEKVEKEYRVFGSVGVPDVVSFPGVFSLEGEDPPEEVQSVIMEKVEEVLGSLEEARKKEGEKLVEDIGKRIASLEEKREKIESLSESHRRSIKEKLLERIKRLQEDVELDEVRLNQEVLFYLERSDITEELVRIDSHLKFFQEVLRKDEPIGRKLDFLCQELLREINTIGSKNSLSEISRLVVEFKEELEKVRQQVQNLE